jgi:hypothetical protein
MHRRSGFDEKSASCGAFGAQSFVIVMSEINYSHDPYEKGDEN